jgi:chromosome segregation ATPase
LRLASNSRCLGDRAELLVDREADLLERAQTLDQETQALQQAIISLNRNRVQAVTKLARLRELSSKLENREAGLRHSEEKVEWQAAEIAELEKQTTAKEEAVAEEELQLMEDRNRVEAACEHVHRQRSDLDDGAFALQQQRFDIERELQDLARERQLLQRDKEMLTEIEEQVCIVRQNLNEQERVVAAEELDLRARQADGEERATQLLPECQHAVAALTSAELRLHELHDREEQSRQQLCRLMRRQRDQGGEDVRLNGLEVALRRQGSGVVQPAAVVELDEHEMQKRLHQLTQEGTQWSARLQMQQQEVLSLEVKVRQLEGKLQVCPTPLRKSRIGNGFLGPKESSAKWAAAKRKSA